MANVADIDVEYLVAFDMDTEKFVDFVRSDVHGLSFRTDGQTWQLYQPGDFSLDGSEIIDVDEAFVEFADKVLSTQGTPTREQALKYAADDGKATE